MCKARRQRNFQSVWMDLANYIMFNVPMCAFKEFFLLYVTAPPTKRYIRFFVSVLISFPCSHLYWAYCQSHRNVETFRSRKWSEGLLWCWHIHLPCDSSCFVPVVPALHAPWCQRLFLQIVFLCLGCQACPDLWIILTPLYLSYAGCSSPHRWPQGSSWICSGSWSHLMAGDCLVLTGTWCSSVYLFS